MQEENYDVEIYTLTDEDGVESEFELIGSLDIDGQSYVALVPVDEAETEKKDDEEYGFVVLKVVKENDEEVFVSIDDDEEFDRVADAFEDELMADLDYDENATEE